MCISAFQLQQVGVEFKNVLPEYRNHMIGRKPRSFKDLLDLGREFEKAKKLDDRYLILTGKKWHEVTCLWIKRQNEDVKNYRDKQTGSKSRKKKCFI